MQPLLSIIIPVFQTEQYLPKCIDSCLEQDFQDIELIIVDDCSSCECRKIYTNYKKTHPNIHYVRHHSNLGLLCARITGINHAKGKFITHLDSDDWIGKNTYNSCIPIFNKTQCDVVIFNTNSVGPNGDVYFDPRSQLDADQPLISKDTILKNIILNKVKQWGWHVSWNKIWKSKHLKKQLEKLPASEHIIMFEDLWLSIYFFSNLNNDQHCYVNNNTDGVFYNRHDQASTATTSSDNQALKKLDDTRKISHLLRELNLKSSLPVSDDQFNDFINNLALVNYPHPRHFLSNPLQYAKMCNQYIKSTSSQFFLSSSFEKISKHIKNFSFR